MRCSEAKKTLSTICPNAQMSLPRDLKIVAQGPIGLQRLHEDTIVINENGWYRT
jgi:hypothetical protein